MFSFSDEKQSYRPFGYLEFNESDLKNSRRAKLGQRVTKKNPIFLYEYDFGDSWNHELILEDIRDNNLSSPSLFCLDGERACPPEDCGGPFGYAELLGIIS
jgi:hypothetical protein